MVQSSGQVSAMPLFCGRERVNRASDTEKKTQRSQGWNAAGSRDSRETFLGMYWLGEVRWGRRSSDAAA